MHLYSRALEFELKTEVTNYSEKNEIPNSLKRTTYTSGDQILASLVTIVF